MKHIIFTLLTQDYKLILASTPQDFQIVKKLRAHVIITKYPEFKQTEEYNDYLFNEEDRQSFIYLLYHENSNTYVGSVRLFFINKTTSDTLLPMEKYLNDSSFNKFKNKEMPICEISRFSLIDNLQPHPKLSILQLRNSLRLGLIIATRINLFLYQYSQVFSVMEPSLHRILKSQGVDFKQIGKAINHYGKRIPYQVNQTHKNMLLHKSEKTMGELTRYYLKELCKDPEPFWQFIDANPYLERSDIQLDRICQLFKKYGDDVDLSLLLGEEKS